MVPRRPAPFRIDPAPTVVETRLAEALATATGALDGVQPILRHLLGATDQALFSDRILARVRNLLHDLARQLVAGLGVAPLDPGDGRCDALLARLAGEPSLLAHVHALALEAALADRLDERIGLDPVVSPLLEALLAASEPETAALAERVRAAQTRFVEAQRRGALPLGDLPGDLLHNALATLRAHFGAGDPVNDARAGALARTLRTQFVGSLDRASLLDRLIARMGPAAAAALDIADAGAAMFVTALRLGSGQDRDAAILTTNESQVTRLALALVASGVDPASVERQVELLHVDAELPAGLLALRPDRAAALLAATGR
ncbi:MAG: hypothetical protein ABW194_04685 [Novosphingobium sp.]